MSLYKNGSKYSVFQNVSHVLKMIFYIKYLPQPTQPHCTLTKSFSLAASAKAAEDPTRPTHMPQNKFESPK